MSENRGISEVIDMSDSFEARFQAKQAAESDDVLHMQKLFDKGVNMNTKTYVGCTLLFEATHLFVA